MIIWSVPANAGVPGGTREDVMVPVDPDTRPEKRENFLTSLYCKPPAMGSTKKEEEKMLK
jgi:hypothetical protein